MAVAASPRVDGRVRTSLLDLGVHLVRLCVFVHVFLPRGGLGSLPRVLLPWLKHAVAQSRRTGY
jgi:hypothetical protein